jgi:hypothetical protein
MKPTGMEDNSEAKPLAQIERHSYSEVGWISRQNLLALRSRQNFFLDIPFYRNVLTAGRCAMGMLRHRRSLSGMVSIPLLRRCPLFVGHLMPVLRAQRSPDVAYPAFVFQAVLHFFEGWPRHSDTTGIVVLGHHFPAAAAPPPVETTPAFARSYDRNASHRRSRYHTLNKT